jgi:hypothetical protein
LTRGTSTSAVVSTSKNAPENRNFERKNGKKIFKKSPPGRFWGNLSGKGSCESRGLLVSDNEKSESIGLVGLN